ncbi:MAG: metallophosphoesterase [Nanoarchaeota archaeon]|nr:metallophosphoesterase [Nanoarchaeota archaeon]MBU4086637.1 metallophosphoesterase [Nanoarchaeota archaeon]
MVIAVCSDIHGDIRKLEKLAEELDKIGIPPKQTYICGDLVYSGNFDGDKECMTLAREKGYALVSGNHEDHAYHHDAGEFFSYLNALAKVAVSGKALFSHTIPPISWDYIETPEMAFGTFEYLSSRYPDTQVCFIGHTHVPHCFMQSEKSKNIITQRASRFTLPERTRAIISPGSLKTTRQFILYDSEKSEIRRLKIPKWNFTLFR